jgi:hypothetical protein
MAELAGRLLVQQSQFRVGKAQPLMQLENSSLVI